MQNEVEYIVEDAACTVFENISFNLKLKVSPDDIIKVLNIEFAYQQRVGLTDDNIELCGYPYPLNATKMESYIISESIKEGINLNENDLEEILDAETIYLKKLGLIDEDGMQPFHN